MSSDLPTHAPALGASGEGLAEGRWSAVTRPVLESAAARWSDEFGAGSQATLQKKSAHALAQVLADDEVTARREAERLCMQLERQHRAQYGTKALQAELADVRERDAAVTSDEALVRYQAKWERKLTRLQRLYPQRWRVPGLSDEEVRDLLTLRLIEAVRNESAAQLEALRPGKEWGLLVVQQALSVLRRGFRLGATPTDFSELALPEREANQEERWLELEGNACRALAEERAQKHLSRPQRQWLAAMKLSARAGECFQASAQPNLSAASRVLGKNRSSAQRAYKELQTQFGRELDRYK